MKRTNALWRRASLAAAAIIAVAVWRYDKLPQAAPAPQDSVKTGGAATAQIRLTPPGASTQASTHALMPAGGPAERALDPAALRRSLAGRSDAESEVQRIVAFARFRDRVAAYGENKDTLARADRTLLARQILADLPDHVARNELVPVQAEVITAALLTDAEPDPSARSAALNAMRRQWDAYARETVGASPARDPRYVAYARQSKDIVQQVQASVPDPQQQQVVIARRLQALRVQLFDRASSPDTH